MLPTPTDATEQHPLLKLAVALDALVLNQDGAPSGPSAEPPLDPSVIQTNPAMQDKINALDPAEEKMDLDNPSPVSPFVAAAEHAEPTQRLLERRAQYRRAQLKRERMRNWDCLHGSALGWVGTREINALARFICEQFDVPPRIRAKIYPDILSETTEQARKAIAILHKPYFRTSQQAVRKFVSQYINNSCLREPLLAAVAHSGNAGIQATVRVLLASTTELASTTGLLLDLPDPTRGFGAKMPPLFTAPLEPSLPMETMDLLASDSAPAAEGHPGFPIDALLLPTPAMPSDPFGFALGTDPADNPPTPFLPDYARASSPTILQQSAQPVDALALHSFPPH